MYIPPHLSLNMYTDMHMYEYESGHAHDYEYEDGHVYPNSYVYVCVYADVWCMYVCRHV